MGSSIEILKANNLRKTEIRKKILDLFLQSDNALSLARIESSFERLDRTTLYRTLKTFETNRIIHKAVDGTNHPKFAICKSQLGEGRQHDNHAHFHCTSCEKTICLHHLPVPEIPNLDEIYRIRQMDLILSGICPDCR